MIWLHIAQLGQWENLPTYVRNPKHKMDQLIFTKCATESKRLNILIQPL